MCEQTSPRDNLFTTCAIHLNIQPSYIMRNDPPCCHGNDEAIAKIHRFCHEIYKVPITWLCSHPCLVKYGETLKRFVHEYGDEVAIQEHGIASQSAVDNQPEVYQAWVEECGLKRPGAGFQSKEAESIGGMGFYDMPYEDQKVALTYLKDVYDKTLGQKTRTLATSNANLHTVRIMSEIGMDISWGFCWNYFCEGMNHKGSLPFPFYISHQNHSVPEQDAGKSNVLAIHWGIASHLIFNHAEVHCKHAGPGFCTNPLEMANRSEGLDKYDLHRKLIHEMASWARWNKFVHLPLQLEAIWLSEDELPGKLYDVYPTYNSANTEVLYTQIETALRVGAKPVTFSKFADWHRQNVKDTAECVLYNEDPLPEVRNRGKDCEYQPQVLYGSKTHQYWFDLTRGFNYIRRYRYNPIVPETKIENEYPFDPEPPVYLKIKHSNCLSTGLVIAPEKISYEVRHFDLTAYRDEPDYAGILWQANIPSYVKDSDILTGGAIKGFKTVREKNIAILFADLKKGNNEMIFRSDLPAKYVRVVRNEKVGKRHEIWIQNDADETFVHTLDVMTRPGYRVGGYWWDGHYNRTIHRFGMSFYDRESGHVVLWAVYPSPLKLNRGLTRCSIELL